MNGLFPAWLNGRFCMNFNASTHRSAIGEWLTSIGRKTKGKPFYVEIRGEKAITESGTLEAKSSKWRIY